MALILVTGGAGFIGSHLTQALVARGDRVRILDDFSSGTMDNLAALETGAVQSGAPVEILKGDVVDRALCEQATHATEPDHAEALAGDFGAHQAFLVPGAASGPSIG